MTIKNKQNPNFPEGTIRIGYVRLSRDDAKSMSVENQVKALRAYDPSMKIVIDKGVSGETNISDPKTAWNRELMPFLREHPTACVVSYGFDRVGRKKGKVLNWSEDHIGNGGSFLDLKENKLFDDAENFEQSITLSLSSLFNENYRVEVSKKTQRAIDVLKDAGVKLGRKPHLYEKDLKQIRDLHQRGMGYTAIGKVVRTRRVSDGNWQNTSRKVIKQVIEGTYVSREEFDRRNMIARLSMLAPGDQS